MKKYIFLLTMLPAVLLFLSGCLPGSSKNKAVKTHKLKLSSYPEGATAHVAGKKFNLPYEFKMSPGSYLFRIEKPGYAPAWFSCRVQPSGITIPRTAANGSVRWEKLSPASRQIELQKQGGTVLLQSNPDTATVTKDGKQLGVTPLVLTDLPPGKHEVQLASPNHAEVTVSWEIRDSRPFIQRTDLQSNIAQLTISSEPSGARLFIADREIGTTPYQGTCPAGTHSIRLLRDGCVPYEGHITLIQGETTEKEIHLTPSPCKLQVTSSPAGAQVFLNEQLRGTTPLVLENLSGGTYKIAVTHDGYDSMETTVKLTPGSSLRKKFTLGSSQGGIELNIYPAGVKVFLNEREVGVVQQGETPTQTRLLRVSNLKPGTYVVKAVHKRADPETVEIKVTKGKITRPNPIILWVPNAEIVWLEDGRRETGIIYGESETSILFGPEKGIKIGIDKKDLKSIKFLDINE